MLLTVSCTMRTIANEAASIKLELFFAWLRGKTLSLALVTPIFLLFILLLAILLLLVFAFVLGLAFFLIPTRLTKLVVH